jgi:hypothetical protein
MISINVPKTEVKEKEVEPSISQKNLLRTAKEDAEKKMTQEKYERLKKAGVVK